MAEIYANAKWHIVLTKPGCEKKVAGYLQKKHIESYCPLNPQFTSDSRSKTVLEPLFKSYVFVKMVDSQVQQVMKTPGIIRFVYWLNKPATVKQLEIETIQFFLHQYQTLQIEKTEVDVHESVKSIRGSSITKAGNVTEMLNNSIKAILPSLGYILIAQIPDTVHNGKVLFSKTGTTTNVEKQII